MTDSPVGYPPEPDAERVVSTGREALSVGAAELLAGVAEAEALDGAPAVAAQEQTAAADART